MTAEKTTSLPVQLETGRAYRWCACGGSPIKPLCDGSHSVADGLAQPLTFVAELNGTVYLCACTRTTNPPYCDGFNCNT